MISLVAIALLCFAVFAAIDFNRHRQHQVSNLEEFGKTIRESNIAREEWRQKQAVAADQRIPENPISD